ncbi:MAG: M14 family metallopeptidase [Candidatus Thermoplasmatota archaeon]|nr:M14 family metallopeptidase [Candidatus Thermoplasmatota archaeon]
MRDRGSGSFKKFCIALYALLLIVTSLPFESGAEPEAAWSYHTSYEIDSILTDLASSRPDIAMKTTAWELLGIPDAEGGRSIPILFIGNMSDPSRSNLMFIGAHHGNEPDSAEAVLAFASYILEGENDRVRYVTSRLNLIVLPVVNPYGLDMGTRYDETGEDPNRDYPFMASSSSAYSDGIPLNTAGARTVHELARMYPTDIALSFHTGSFGIFTPWGAASTGNMTPDHVCFMELASAISRASGLNMPYGPANDFKGVSYLMGAFDDHLYGSSVFPDRLYSQDMILPWSSASFTVELRTGLGEEPEGLGTLHGVDSEPPSLQVIPSAVRMCLAACMMARVDASYDLEVTAGGSTASFEVRGVSSIDGLNLGTDEGEALDPDDLRTHPRYPEISLSATPPEGAKGVRLFGDPRASWRAHLEGSYPNVSPRSLLSASSVGGIDAWVGLPSREEEAHIEIVGIDPMIAQVGSGVEVTVIIEMPEGEHISGLDLVTISNGFEMALPYTAWEIVSGENVLEASAGIVEGSTRLEARLHTNKGTHVRRAAFHTAPWIAVSAEHYPVDHSLKVIMGLEGARKPAYAHLTLSPAGGWEGPVLGPFTRLLPQDGIEMFEIDVSMLDGEYEMLSWTGTFEPRPYDRFFFYPRIRASELPLRIVGTTLILGPLTVFEGDRCVEHQGAVRAVVVRPDGFETWIDMPFVPFESLNPEDALIALNQASRAGVTGEIAGAYLLAIDLPWPGTYEVMGYVTGPNGPVPFGSGITPPQMEALRYGSFEVMETKEQERGFPFALIALFTVLIIIISVVTYLRYPARMRQIAESMSERPDGRSRTAYEKRRGGRR